MDEHNEYDLFCRKMAEKMALSSVHLSELDDLQNKIAKFLIENEFGYWASSTISGEFHFMRQKPFHCDCI